MRYRPRKQVPTVFAQADDSIQLTNMDQPFAIKPVDWSPFASAVQNQGLCGSCWAFSSVAVVQINYRLSSGQNQTRKFSQQQLIDCLSLRGYSQNSCQGGIALDAFNYISLIGVIEEILYPYVGYQSDCRDYQFPKFKIIKTTDPGLFYTGLRSALRMLQRGAVSVGVDASQWGDYKSGVFSCKQANISLNHEVSLVGVDESGIWKVRNSWGNDWGEQGYIRLNSTSDCGVTQQISVPNLL